MSKFPKKPGPFWVALDDGNGSVEVVLVHVRQYADTPLTEGAICEFVDGSGWGFEVSRFENGILVQPSRVTYAASRGSQSRGQAKLTWYGEAKAPRAALKQVPEVV